MTVQLANVLQAISFFAARVGTGYAYGAMFSPTNPKLGTDCSGEVDTILRILTTGNGGPVDANGRYIRTLSTESWPYNYAQDLAVAVGTIGPYGTVCAGDAQAGPAPTVYPPKVPDDAAAIIYLMHGGGGENSHVMIAVRNAQGQYVVMETGGAHNDTGGNGQYQSPSGPATATDDAEWTDIWYVPGPVIVSGDTPPPSGQDTTTGALTQHQSDQLSQLWGALFNPIYSQSPFRSLGEGAIWQQHQIPINDDGLIHPQYVEWAAQHGDPIELANLQTLAGADPVANPDRARGIALAQAVLARLGSPAAVTDAPVPGPVPGPVPVPSPDVVEPVTPQPSEPATQLANAVKTGVTILGGALTVGTWVLQAFGHVMSPEIAAAISSTLVVGTGWLSHLVTVEQSLAGDKSLKVKLSRKGY